MLDLLEEKVKQERETSELSRLDKDFFFKLQEHIGILKSANDLISQRKLQLMQELLQELVDLRAEKILKGHQTGMLTPEVNLAQFASTFKKFKKDALKSLLQEEATTQRVIVLQDLPQFYGPELEILGPYKKGEVVLLDRTVVTLLKEENLVEER
ncbi:MAG: hypothetical protein HXS48_13055 [Theionarchaea archaeon]|nr:MAG: hypothetical protein AYK19_17030 [Theionarchaea archaeon DG-70-1]MBU7027858.1 hypothetical protein [Theionarchaea archaeon]